MTDPADDRGESLHRHPWGGDHATHLDHRPDRPGPAARGPARRPGGGGTRGRSRGHGYTISEARAVKDRGQAVGDSIPAGLGPEHAFLWEHGRMRDLGTLGGLTSDATDINNHGQVVGASMTAAGGEFHAVLWR